MGIEPTWDRLTAGCLTARRPRNRPARRWGEPRREGLSRCTPSALGRRWGASHDQVFREHGEAFTQTRGVPLVAGDGLPVLGSNQGLPGQSRRSFHWTNWQDTRSPRHELPDLDSNQGLPGQSRASSPLDHPATPRAPLPATRSPTALHTRWEFSGRKRWAQRDLNPHATGKSRLLCRSSSGP